MNHPLAKLCLLSLVVSFAAPQRCCARTRTRTRTGTRRAAPEKLRLVRPAVSCSPRRIRAAFGSLVSADIRVKDETGAVVAVPRSGWACGVRVGADPEQQLSFLSRYDSCYARFEDQQVVISLQVQLMGEDQWYRVNISCPLIKTYSEGTRRASAPSPGNCNTRRALRVDCGPPRISSDGCHKLGCCYDSSDSTCYHRLNACSLDGHLVFSVKTWETEPAVDPSSLVVKDQPLCVPAVATHDTAVFRIQVGDCGMKMKVDGDAKIYEVEVEEQRAKGENKHSPLSLQVQCEYEASKLKRAASLRSLYPVSNPPPVVASGTIRVQLRIATDASFTSFFTEDQLPVMLPLRKVAYVEVSIAQPSPDPALSLHVRDCFAYPASRRSVWTLLYDGCPNPMDDMRSSFPVDEQGKTSTHSQVRRFDVKTFAFLDPDKGQPSVEEMFFHCWVEICTEEVVCVQPCAIIASEGNKRRREVPPDSSHLQMVSFGPLWLGRNDSNPEENPCIRQRDLFRATVYTLSGVGAALLLLLMFSVWSNIRKRRKAEAQRACDTQVDGDKSQ